MSDTKSESPTGVGRASNTDRFVVQTADGWAVKAGGAKRASSLHGTQAEAIAAARETVGREGGALTIRTFDGRARATYTIGRDPFRKISAVEGIASTAAAEARAESFTRRKLSSEERLRAIIEVHRPAEG